MRTPSPTMAGWNGWGRAFRVAAFGALICTFGLLVAGGLVTSLEVGMSVPDATTTMGSPLVTAPQVILTAGQRVEHSHRLAGMIVGNVTLLLAVIGIVGAWRGALATRTGVFAGLALCGVAVQGFLGMARVAQNSVPWAMVHASVAQAVFCLLAGLATVSLARWPRLRLGAAEQAPRRLALLTVAVVYGQVLLGILTRHLGPLHGGSVAEWHVVGALIATGCVGALAMASMAVTPLRGLAMVLVLLCGAQLALGMAAWGAAYTVDAAAGTAPFAVAVATGHVAVGAALLGTTVSTALVAWQAQPAAVPLLPDGPTPVPYVPEPVGARVLA